MSAWAPPAAGASAEPVDDVTHDVHVRLQGVPSSRSRAAAASLGTTTASAWATSLRCHSASEMP